MAEAANVTNVPELEFHGCRVSDVHTERGEEFVLNVHPNRAANELSGRKSAY